jgi:hypothetical protein
MRPALAAALLLAAAGILSACQPTLQAPTDHGVCWQLSFDAAGKNPKFNRLADHQPDLEHCAAQLEMMRLRFAGLGLSQERVTGAYQGQYLFIQREGVFTSDTYEGYHYPFMVRSGDGRLAIPGAMPQGQ